MSTTLTEVLTDLAEQWREDPDDAADELTDALSEATVIAGLSKEDALEFMQLVQSQASLWVNALKSDLGIIN